MIPATERDKEIQQIYEGMLMGDEEKVEEKAQLSFVEKWKTYKAKLEKKNADKKMIKELEAALIELDIIQK